MATFMAAAFKEQQLGREAYMVTVSAWRERLTQLRAAGHDKPLVFPDWDRPTADDRAVVYQKGALVLHELRGTLGDAVFWKALRAYTREYFGRSVTTADFQAAIEEASGRHLEAFFDEWVYLTDRKPSKQAPPEQR
jgi:aminopeptidase N